MICTDLRGGAGGSSDLDGLGAAVIAVLDGELDGLALGKRAEAIGHDGRLQHGCVSVRR